MTCQQVLEFLMRYEEGELSDAERAEFDRHLGLCPTCVRYLSSYRRTVELAAETADSPPPQPPQELISAILAARRAGSQGD